MKWWFYCLPLISLSLMAMESGENEGGSDSEEYRKVWDREYARKQKYKEKQREEAQKPKNPRFTSHLEKTDEGDIELVPFTAGTESQSEVVPSVTYVDQPRFSINSFSWKSLLKSLCCCCCR